MAILRTIFSDFFGLWRVCGPFVALRWLLMVGLTFPRCARARNLQPADRAMGDGPFACRLRGASAALVGEQVISGVREIWVRDVYLGGGFVEIRPADTVVDLGANMGNFTLLALGHGPGVRVVSVEADPRHCEKLRRSLDANGWASRAMVVNAFIGSDTPFQHDLRRQPEFADVPTISQADFLSRNSLTRIDFLKCDIEGSEFSLLTPDSPILRITRAMAMELHTDIGDADAFMAMLRAEGFEVNVWRVAGPTVLIQARRP